MEPDVGRDPSSELASALVRSYNGGSFLDSLTRTLPDNNGRMIPVAANHVAHVANDQFLPRLVAEIAPTGRFLPNHQSQFIARVQKRFGLRIMRAADHVDIKFALENFRVATHHPRRHREAGVRINFMPVQTKKSESLAVQEKSVHIKPRLTQSDPGAIFVQRFARDHERCDDLI